MMREHRRPTRAPRRRALPVTPPPDEFAKLLRDTAPPAQTPEHLHRRRLADEIRAIFRRARPTDDEMIEITRLAEVVIDRVYNDKRVTQDEGERLYSDVKDYAECAALYGFALGFARAARALGDPA